MASDIYLPHPSPRARRRPMARWTILAFWLLVIVPVAVAELPRERARWRYARAMLHVEHARYQQGLAELQKAVQLDPRHSQYPLAQADIYRRLATITYRPENGAVTAKRAELDQAFDHLRKAEKGAEPEQLLSVLQARADLFMRLHRWKDAAQQIKLARKLAESTTGGVSPQMLNQTAYLRALANMELDESLADIKAALDMTPNRPTHAMTRASFLDTRGYIYYQRGEFTKALEDFNRSIALYEPVYKQQAEQLRAWPKERIDLSHWKETTALNNQMFATLLYHRVLVNTVFSVEDAKKEQAVLLDEQRIRALGFEPNDDIENLVQ